MLLCCAGCNQAEVCQHVVPSGQIMTALPYLPNPKREAGLDHPYGTSGYPREQLQPRVSLHGHVRETPAAFLCWLYLGSVVPAC